MEQSVLFEKKVALTPKDMNRMGKESVDSLLLAQLRQNLEGKCSQHGFVIQNSLEIISRSMGQLEHGRYTGNVVFHIQVQGKVYNPANGTRIRGKIDKKNKMGLYIIYNDAVRILVPRDLHIGNERFDALEPGQEIEIEIRKSRFQIQDLFILSIGVLMDGNVPVPAMIAPVEAPAPQEESEPELDEESEPELDEESEAEAEVEKPEPLLGNLEIAA